MKTIEVEIRGVTPLLIQRFNEQAEVNPSTRRTLVKREEPREVAHRAAYIAPDGTFYFNSYSIMGTMTNAGSNHKMKGSRKTLRFVVPSSVRVEGEGITILNGDGSPAKDFEVDSRPVTIPATKGRVMRHRPRFDIWSAKFNLLLDDDQLDIETAYQLLAEAGRGVGIGDFRPEKRGPFGTFQIVHWEVLSDSEPRNSFRPLSVSAA